MKNNREFLDGIWEIVAQAEYEETQKELAKTRHKKIMRKNIMTYLSAAVIFISIFISVLLVEAFSSYIIICIITLVSLVFAYIVEGFLSDEHKTKGISYHEN